jgi:hypothetical protein
MSTVVGANHNPLVNYLLNPGQPGRLEWSGGNANFIVGFPFPSAVFTQASRIVVTENTMEWRAGIPDDGLVYGTNLRAESNGTGAPAAFRMQLGQLS